MEKYSFNVEKMTCDGCAARVKAAAESIEGVGNVVVERNKKLLTVESAIDPSGKIVEKVTATGYPTEIKTGLFKKLFS